MLLLLNCNSPNPHISQYIYKYNEMYQIYYVIYYHKVSVFTRQVKEGLVRND